MAEDDDNPDWHADERERLSRIVVGSPFFSLAKAGAWIAVQVIKPLRRAMGVADQANDPLALLNHAGETLRVALARGELTATGVNVKTYAVEVIPALFWERASVAAVSFPPKWPDGRATLPNGQEPFCDIRIDSRQLEEQWPDKPNSVPIEAPPPVEAPAEGEGGQQAAPDKAETPPPPQKTLGGYQVQDEPLLQEMHRLVEAGWKNRAAARKLAPQAEGPTSLESKADRLRSTYRRRHKRTSGQQLGD